MTRLVLVRHGQTAWNAEGRIQGQIDVPLDAVGVAQAASLGSRFVLSPDAGSTVLVASDLARAWATAAPLAAATGLPVVPDKRLREIELGAWEGLTDAEAAARFPDEHAAWVAGDPTVRRGGGETMVEVAERALACLQDHLEDAETVVFVSHGGTSRSLIARLLELPHDRWQLLGGLGNCRVSALASARSPAASPGWRLWMHNAADLRVA